MDLPGRHPVTLSRRRAVHSRLLLALTLLPLLPVLSGWVFRSNEETGLSSAGVLVGALFALLLAISLARGIHARTQADFASALPSASAEIDHSETTENDPHPVMDAPEPGSERLEAATRTVLTERDRLLADLAHELRTPLNAVFGYLALMRRAGLPPEQHRHTDIIEQASTQMLGLLDDMLADAPPDTEASRHEAGFELRKTVEAVLAMLKPRADERGLALGLQVDPDVPQQLPGNPIHLRQVLLNLISNAIRFTHEGKVTVFIDLRADADGDALAVRVADTGIGIAKDVHEHIFEPFRQADSSIAGRYGGSGLGLAIALRLVRLWGGRMGVNSVPGQGSVFWFTQPLAPEPMRIANPEHAPNPSDRNDFLQEKDTIESEYSSELEGLRILVAEDNAFSRELVTHLLTAAGALVDAAASAGAMLQRAGTTRYDLAIVDLRLPDMHGAEAARRLRELPGPRIPILILSADVTSEDEGMPPADACLSKPATPARLLAVIRELTGPLPATVPDSSTEGTPVHLRPQLARSLRELRFRIAAAMDGPEAELAALAHELRGVAGCFGLTDLAGAAGDFERLLGEGGAPEAVARAFVTLDACLGTAAAASDHGTTPAHRATMNPCRHSSTPNFPNPRSSS